MTTEIELLRPNATSAK